MDQQPSGDVAAVLPSHQQYGKHTLLPGRDTHRAKLWRWGRLVWIAHHRCYRQSAYSFFTLPQTYPGGKERISVTWWPHDSPARGMVQQICEFTRDGNSNGKRNPLETYICRCRTDRLRWRGIKEISGEATDTKYCRTQKPQSNVTSLSAERILMDGTFA